MPHGRTPPQGSSPKAVPPPVYVAGVNAMLANTPDATASWRLNVQFNMIPLTICDVSDTGELFQSLSSNASKAYRLVLYSPPPK